MSYRNALVARHDDYVIKHSPPASVGAWIATPGWLRDQINELDGLYETMGKELRAQIEECLPGKPNADSTECRAKMRFTGEVWTPLKSRWDSFEASHRGWFSRLWGSLWDNIKSYREQLIAVRSRAESVGFSFNSPAPAPPESTPWDTIGSVAKWSLYGAIAFAIVMLVRMIKDLF